MARATRRFRKKRRNPDSYKRNPPLFTEVAEWAVPGFVGFAATRGITRITTNQVAKRLPHYAAHAGAISSIAAFLAGWWFLNRVKFLEKYHTPIVVGAAIATAQSLVQIYTPAWASWLLADPTTDLNAAALPAAADDTQSAALPAGMSVVHDDPNDYVYNDAYDAGRQSAPSQPQQSPPAQQATNGEDDLSDLQVDNGIFA